MNPRLRVLPIWAARAGDPTHYLILDRADGLDLTGLQRISGSDTNVQILIFAGEVDIETEPDAEPEDDLS